MVGDKYCTDNVVVEQVSDFIQLKGWPEKFAFFNLTPKFNSFKYSKDNYYLEFLSEKELRLYKKLENKECKEK